MSEKRGPERLTSSSRIAGSLENTPENRAILKNEPIKTSIGHWKAKLIESGFFGEIKDGDDPKTFYAGISRKADDFLKQLFQRARGMPEKWGMVNEDGSLNLDFEMRGELLG